MRELRKQGFLHTLKQRFQNSSFVVVVFSCLLSVDFHGSSKTGSKLEDKVAGPKKSAALTYLELCKDAKMRGGLRGKWESNMGLLSSSSYTNEDDSKTTNNN
jgi:hypothetical protein